MPSLAKINAEIAHLQANLGNLRDTLAATECKILDTQTLFAGDRADVEELSRLHEQVRIQRDRLIGLENFIAKKQAAAAAIYAEERARQVAERKAEFAKFCENHGARCGNVLGAMRALAIALAEFSASQNKLYGDFQPLGGALVAERETEKITQLAGEISVRWRSVRGPQILIFPAFPPDYLGEKV